MKDIYDHFRQACSNRQEYRFQISFDKIRLKCIKIQTVETSDEKNSSLPEVFREMKDFYRENHREYFERTFNIDPSTFLSPLAARLSSKRMNRHEEITHVIQKKAKLDKLINMDENQRVAWKGGIV